MDWYDNRVLPRFRKYLCDYRCKLSLICWRLLWSCPVDLVFLSFNIANNTSGACTGLHDEDFLVIRGCVLSCLAYTSNPLVWCLWIFIFTLHDNYTLDKNITFFQSSFCSNFRKISLALLYHEWPGRWSSVTNVPGSIQLTTLLIYSSHLHVQVALRGYCPVKGIGYLKSIESTISDAITVACCGRLQLRAIHGLHQ